MAMEFFVFLALSSQEEEKLRFWALEEYEVDEEFEVEDAETPSFKALVAAAA